MQVASNKLRQVDIIYSPVVSKVFPTAGQIYNFSHNKFVNGPHENLNFKNSTFLFYLLVYKIYNSRGFNFNNSSSGVASIFVREKNFLYTFNQERIKSLQLPACPIQSHFQKPIFSQAADRWRGCRNIAITKDVCLKNTF